jgi:hypothetical protein
MTRFLTERRIDNGSLGLRRPYARRETASANRTLIYFTFRGTFFFALACRFAGRCSAAVFLLCSVIIRISKTISAGTDSTKSLQRIADQ